MIDKPAQVESLMQKLKENLPIPVMATDGLMRMLRNNSVNISSSSHIKIVDVLYLGDEGGICCALKIAGQEKDAVVISITHLNVPNTNPLSSEIQAYQKFRIKKLSRNR
ncbi:MAG: hypothetical protein ACOYNF_16780 [Rhodoferax sp.]